MFSESTLVSLIGDIYLAAADPHLWPVFLEHLAVALDSGPTSLIFHNCDQNTGNVGAAVRFDPSSVKQYGEYFGARDPWAVKRLLVAGTVMRGEMAISEPEYERTEFYQDFMRPMRAFHQTAAIISHNDTTLAVLSSLRSREAGGYSDSELHLLHALMPHLQQALRIHTKIAGLEWQLESLDVALNKLCVAVVFVNQRGKILSLSLRAEAILGQADGLMRKRDVLYTWTQDEHEKLQRFIVGASETSAGTGLTPGGSMLVSRPSFRKPYSLLISPAPPQLVPGVPAQPTVAIFISDPEAVHEPNDRVLCQLFGLTKAEGRVAAFLMEGKSLDDAADHFAVTRNTVRSQLAQILSKTQTHRQSELIHLLLCSTASLH